MGSRKEPSLVDWLLLQFSFASGLRWPKPRGDETRQAFRGIVKRFIEDEQGPVGLEVLSTTCSGLWQKPRHNPSAVRGHLRPWSTGPSLLLCRSSLDDLYGPDMAMPGTK